MCIRDSQRVTFTTFIFQGEVEHWWEMVKDGAKSAGEEIVWNFLVKKLYKKYIPGVTKDKLAMEFQELQ